MIKPENPYLPKNIEDKISRHCKYFHGEIDNPYDVSSIIPEERRIEFFRYQLWDVEKSLVTDPGKWRLALFEAEESIPSDPDTLAEKIYDFAVRTKLSILSQSGISLHDLYSKLLSLK